jgi:hypothetical protein
MRVRFTWSSQDQSGVLRIKAATASRVSPMAEPCGATSSRSEGTSEGQAARHSTTAEQPEASLAAEARLVACAPAPLQPDDAQQRDASAAKAASPLGAEQDLGVQSDARPSKRRTRGQASKRGLQADFVGGDDSDSDAERESSRRAGSSNSWHPGDVDSDSDASTRKRRKNEGVSALALLEHLTRQVRSVQSVGCADGRQKLVFWNLASPADQISSCACEGMVRKALSWTSC